MLQSRLVAPDAVRLPMKTMPAQRQARCQRVGDRVVYHSPMRDAPFERVEELLELELYRICPKADYELSVACFRMDSWLKVVSYFLRNRQNGAAL
ncbi:hypothetical protein QA645_31720 [Bradyrhizobium sp. CIAT3101]|uniref:hypothetical protein n=1 Tax=Bradyrhizobium sp. CIAT3101 TaxID=439387 RepID=UPI0024B0FA48|nr:hypothetical protein [Bradyrhizobium sp. CIAT3101]WFU79065.1 hypothetical protein QA645_31720 [Bradyrhizobium sp. CIAT3101]